MNVAYAKSVAGPTYFGLPLRTGQVLLSEAPSPHGLLFSLGTETYTPFTHSAIIVVEDGAPYVYDVAADFRPWFASTAADALHGGVGRAPFLEYVGGALYAEVFDPPAGTDPDKLVARLRDLRRREVPFDAHWDFQDKSALYCTEFVAELLAAAGAPTPPLSRRGPNRSLRRALAWFGLETEWVLPAGAFIDETRLVAAVGPWRTRTSGQAYFAAKRELHRRFTADQKVGNLMELDGTELKIRPHVQAYLHRAAHRFDGQAPPPAAVLDAAVRALAEEVFGAFAG
jgi:hypothetical protein